MLKVNSLIEIAQMKQSAQKERRRNNCRNKCLASEILLLWLINLCQFFALAAKLYKKTEN